MTSTFADPALIADPFPVYEEIRPAGRVVWNGAAIVDAPEHRRLRDIEYADAYFVRGPEKGVIENPEFASAA